MLLSSSGPATASQFQSVLDQGDAFWILFSPRAVAVAVAAAVTATAAVTVALVAQ
jgi:hypothetical protein